MNIFFLDKDPQFAAQSLCDKHVPKMLLESAQMLSTAVQKYTDRIEELYKPAYPNHPMTKWVGSTFSNFQWTLENAVFISHEYCKRFNKLHKSSRILNAIYDNQYYKEIPDEQFTPPPQCMPDQYKLRSDLYVKAYRKYYQGEKEYFAKWERGVSAPDWWVHV